MVLNSKLIKMEASMCIFREFGRFVRRGVITFRYASKGQYRIEADGIDEIRKEIFEIECHRSDDRRNLQRDRKAIERDVRVSFNKLTLQNG